MAMAERKEFTDSIQCLQSIPTLISDEEKKVYKRVKTRNDEFVATHINMTSVLHYTADFLALHRYFLHVFEEDLRTKCGFSGTLPYGEWGYDADEPQNSVLFNGDPYSMGPNGVFVPNRTTLYWASKDQYMPAGIGGGCVNTGPFSNYTVNMAPIDSPGQESENSTFVYNPRCLSRDLNPEISSVSLAFRNTTELLLSYDTIDWFQRVTQSEGRFVDPALPGVHGGGHVMVGSVLTDVYVSPSDPTFYIHHAQVDRIWTIWQGLDSKNRRDAIWGTHTAHNKLVSSNMTLDDQVEFGFISGPQRFADLMDTMSGAFCYYYE